MRNVRAWWRSADEIILVFPRDYESVPNDIQVSGAENYKAMRSPIEELARYCNYYIDGDIAHFFLEVENKMIRKVKVKKAPEKSQTLKEDSCQNDEKMVE